MHMMTQNAPEPLMTRLNRQIETRLGIDDAFAFIADFGNAMHWDPGVASSEAVDTARSGLGSRSRLGVRLGSRVAPMEYRVTTFDPPSVVVLTGSGSNVEAVDEIRFAPSGSGTRHRLHRGHPPRRGAAPRAAVPGPRVREARAGRRGGHAQALDARADAATAAHSDAAPAGAPE